MGRSSATMVLVFPNSVTVYWALGQLTEPAELGLVSEYHVPAVALIQGPSALGCRRKLVTQEATYPTSGALDTWPSTVGIAAGLIACAVVADPV